MQHRLLRIDRKNHVATLTLNRPEKKNSLSPELVDLLLQTLQEFSADDTIRTVVMRGEGDHAFCAGYDIGSLPTSRSDDRQALPARPGRTRSSGRRHRAACRSGPRFGRSVRSSGSNQALPARNAMAVHRSFRAACDWSGGSSPGASVRQSRAVLCGL